MLHRENIIRELWRRMELVEGVQYTARNPKKPPNVGDLPAIQFFEFQDRVLETSQRGGYPIYKRTLPVIIESFVAGSSEFAATKDELAFLENLYKQLYAGGATLGKRCSFVEKELSRVLRPATGGHVAGLGMTLEIVYVENMADIMV